MQSIFFGLTWLLLVSFCHGLIAPQEIVSLASLVYSVFPPIKKGTDSRTGFGFRLGNHADFQVTFEVGPQRYTSPLGMPFPASTGDDISNASKRMADLEAYNKAKPSNKKSSNEKNTSHKRRQPQIAPPENDLLKVLFGTMNQYALPASTIKAKSASRQLAKAKEAKIIGTSPSKSIEKQKVLDTEGADKLKKEQQIETDLSQISNLTNNKRTDDSSV